MVFRLPLAANLHVTVPMQPEATPPFPPSPTPHGTKKHCWWFCVWISLIFFRARSFDFPVKSLSAGARHCVYTFTYITLYNIFLKTCVFSSVLLIFTMAVLVDVSGWRASRLHYNEGAVVLYLSRTQNKISHSVQKATQGNGGKGPPHVVKKPDAAAALLVSKCR